MLLVASAITLPVSASIALEPGHHDSSTFIYMGEMWATGTLPYVQLFDNKPPGIFALMALAAYTHHTLWAVALIEFLFVMGSIFTFRKLLQACGCPERALLIGTLAMVLMANLSVYGPGNMTETYMLWPMLGSMLAFFCALESRKLGYVFLAGLLSGVACMFKPFGLSVLMAQIVFTLFQERAQQRNVLAWITANLIGAVTAWVPALVYFSRYGGVKEMLDASFLYNVHYGLASKPNFLNTFILLSNRLLPVSTLVLCLALGIRELWKPDSKSLDAWIFDARRSLWALTLLWFAAGLLLVLAAGRGYGHYFMSLTPALGLAGALFFWSIEESEALRGLGLAVGAVLLAPIAMAFVPGLVESVHETRDAVSGRRKVDSIDVAALELKRIATPTSTLLVWGYEPWLFSSTHLHSASRYPTTQYIYDSPRSYAEVGTEILNGMRTTPPDFVVDTPWNYAMNWPHQSDLVQDEFRSMLQSSYTEVWQADSYRIYKRR